MLVYSDGIFGIHLVVTWLQVMGNPHHLAAKEK